MQFSKSDFAFKTGPGAIVSKPCFNFLKPCFKFLAAEVSKPCFEFLAAIPDYLTVTPTGDTRVYPLAPAPALPAHVPASRITL